MQAACDSTSKLPGLLQPQGAIGCRRSCSEVHRKTSNFPGAPRDSLQWRGGGGGGGAMRLPVTGLSHPPCKCRQDHWEAMTPVGSEGEDGLGERVLAAGLEGAGQLEDLVQR